MDKIKIRRFLMCIIAALAFLITTQITNIALQSLADHNFKPAKNWEQRQ